MSYTYRRKIRARMNARLRPFINRLRHRIRRRTAPIRMFLADQVDRLKKWIDPPPHKPSMKEQAMIDRELAIRDARRERLHWARGPLDPALTQAAQPNPEVMRALVGPWRGS